MQNVSERSDVVTVAEICFQQIALHKIETIVHTKFFRDTFCGWNHSRPVDRGHAHSWRLLGERDSPNPRAGCEVENADIAFRLRQLQVIAKLLCAGVAHWNDVFYQFTEELRALGLLVHGDYRSPVAHGITQP